SEPGPLWRCPSDMLHYPKIPGSRDAPAGRSAAFEKLDGTNLRSPGRCGCRLVSANFRFRVTCGKIELGQLPERIPAVVVITFPDAETQKKALGFLLGRFSGKVLEGGEHIVPEAALAALAEKN